MTTLKQRIEEAYAERPDRKVIKTTLWKAAKTTSATCSNWFSDRQDTIHWDHALAVAPLLGVNPRWLYDGTGAKRGPDVQLPPPVRKGDSDEEKINRIKSALVLMLEAAGLPADAVSIRLKVAASDVDHIDSAHSDDEAAAVMQQNVARHPQGFGRELDPTAGAGREKKSPAGKAGEGQ